MFGMHGCIDAHPGQGDALAAILLEAAEAAQRRRLLPAVFRQPLARGRRRDLVTEAWTDREAHEATFADEATRAMIARARPLIAGFSGRSEFRPVGGKGLP